MKVAVEIEGSATRCYTWQGNFRICPHCIRGIENPGHGVQCVCTLFRKVLEHTVDDFGGLEPRRCESCKVATLNYEGV